MAYTTFIQVDQLAEALAQDASRIVLVDCRFDLDHPDDGEELYLEGHIPGAVYAHLDRDLSAPPGEKTGRHPLPTVEELTATFSRLGIDSSKQVIAYDLPFAARLWWLLRYLGHKHVAVLDGGISAWSLAGKPFRSGRETMPSTSFQASVQTSLVIRAEDILNTASSGADLLLIDSRSPERYRGEHEPRDPVAARIPGAVNRFWQNNLDERGFIRSREEIQQAFSALGDPGAFAHTAAYCGSGVTAAVNVLAMDYAGIEPVRLYPGSWSHWCSDPSRPIARG